MIYLFAALYCEAKPLIEHFNLVKNTSVTQFQVFTNDQMELVVSGTGSIAAAVAVSNTFTRNMPKEDDIMINIGCAGIVDLNHRGSELAPIGQMFCCNKIMDATTGFTYYPDMIYPCHMSEIEVMTDGQIIQEKNVHKNLVCHDMEAAGIYQAAAYYMGPHQMMFFKIISDYGLKPGERIKPSDISQMVAQNIHKIEQCIDHILHFQKDSDIQDKSQHKCRLDDNEIYQVSAMLHCSNVMQHQLIQLIRYCQFSSIDYEKLIKTMLEKHELPCHDKREGKVRFEQIKRQLL